MIRMPELPDREECRRIFDGCCRDLGIDEYRDSIKDLAIYSLTDGTRTSTDLKGWQAYADGGVFILRLFHMLKNAGSRYAYVLTTGDAHTTRDNYQEIMKALVSQVELYRDYSTKNGMRMVFAGNMDTIQGPGLEGFKKSLQGLQEETKGNRDFTAYVLINYSSQWAMGSPEFKKLPNANVIIKHTKGQINEGLWLPDKLHGNSFVYVQNASVSTNWTDEQLMYLIAISLRSMLLHKGMQYSKSYGREEKDTIRRKREEEMYMVHKRFSEAPTKRIVIFSHLGPEIYEF